MPFQPLPARAEFEQGVGLDAATGAVRWTLPMSGIGPQTDAVATADGGLAVAGMLGQLPMVEMADGDVRWSRAITDSTGLADSPDLVPGQGVLARPDSPSSRS